MNANGQLRGKVRAQRAFDKRGKEMTIGPEYQRSRSLSSINIGARSELGTAWVRRVKMNEGLLTFNADAESGTMQACQNHCDPIDAYTLGKVNNNAEGDSQVDVSTDFYPLLHRMMQNKKGWGVGFNFRGRACLEVGLMEWTDHVLRIFKNKLIQADILGAVAVSRYAYEFSSDVWKAFCELWSPLSNTLHHGNGEISISLYDLKVIGGLPISGIPYEEFIPLNAELKREADYPLTVGELLRIHSQLCDFHQQSQIYWNQWLRHFYRGKIFYAGFCDSKKLTLKQREKFGGEKLSLEVSDEGALAAYLAYWLSRFVLPSHSARVRPEAFYMACLMAQGAKVSLAPVTLGHIYHGLGVVATHHKGPGLSDAAFPIHYVIGWLGEHFPCLYRSWDDNEFPENYPYLKRYAGISPSEFNITEARIIFRVAQSVVYRPSAFDENDGRFLVDDGQLTDDEFDLLVCIRPALLPVRVGTNLWLEPYYPNRFSRQFGLDQSVPSNELNFDFSKRGQCGIESLAEAQAPLLKRDTTSVFYIPRSTYVGRCTYLYCRWWSRRTGPYLLQSVSRIHMTLTQTPLTNRPAFEVSNLRKISVGLKKEISFSEIEKRNLPSPLQPYDGIHRSIDKEKDKDATHVKVSKRTSSGTNHDGSKKRACHEKSGSSNGTHVAKNHFSDGVIDIDGDNPVPASRSHVVEVKSNDLAAVESSNECNVQNVGVIEIDCRASSFTRHLLPLKQPEKSICDIIDSETDDFRRNYMVGEIEGILSKLSKSPIEILAYRSAISRSLDFLKPMLHVLGSGKAEIEWYSKTIDRSFELAEQMCKSDAKVGQGVALEECLTVKKGFNSQLIATMQEFEDLKATEPNVKEAEAHARLLRDQYNSAKNSVEDKIQKLKMSLEEQDQLEKELKSQVDTEIANVEACKAREEELQELISSLSSFCRKSS